MSIIIALLIFTIIVVIHEFGHFIAAKKSGIGVEEFAIGMGPKLFGIKRGETLYSVRLLPIGGFCNMTGEDKESENPRGFNNKPAWMRLIVLVAGVAMNVLLALLVFTIVTLFAGFNTPVVDSLMENYPAQRAGIQIGDRITRINGTKINLYEDISFTMMGNTGQAVEMELERGGVPYSIAVTPEIYQDPATGAKGYKIGFTPITKAGVFLSNPFNFPRASVLECVQNGSYQIAFYIKATFVGLERLVTGQLAVNDMSGIIGIVDIIDQGYDAQVQAGQAANVGGGVIAGAIALSMLNFMGLLSANLAVFNLLPLPALDGGRLVFVLFEMITRRPVPPEREGLIHFVGFVLLMAFAIFIAYNDILKLLPGNGSGL